MSLTVAILTLNEEANLPGVLRSAGFADEILVVDGGSTDSTVAVAVAAGVRVVERPFEDFAHQRNVALGLASGEWVCFLDADERVTPELAAELAAFTGPDAGFGGGPAGYRIARTSFVLGERLDWHPGGPDEPIRLVRRDLARFEGAVHERCVVDGEIGRLAGRIEHRTHRSVSDLVGRIDRYSTLEAREQAGRGARVVPPWRLLWTMTSTAWRYWRQGLRKHGMAGAIEACALAFDRALVLGKIWEQHEADRVATAYSDAAPAQTPQH